MGGLIMASKNCGQVVIDRENGVLLPEVTPTAIVKAISELLADPGLLSQKAIEMSTRFQPEGLAATREMSR